MSIATEISRIKDAKDAIRASIIAKGVNVPQAAKLDTYADRIDEIVQTASGNMEVVTSSPSGTINAADNKFYMLSGDAGALVFNLPAMQQGGHGIYLLMTTASTSVVSFTSTGSVTINFPSGFQVEADKCYLMDFEFAQSEWQVSVEEWFVNGGGSDQWESIYASVLNGTVTEYTLDMWPEGVTKAKDSLFSGCTSLVKLEVPDTITYAGPNWLAGTQVHKIVAKGVTSCGNDAFRQRDPLEFIYLPALTNPGQNAFMSSPNINKIVFGPNFKSTAFGVFYAFNALATIDLSACTQLGNLGNNTFTSATPHALKLPSSCTGCGSSFLNNTTRTILEINATTPPTLNNTFNANWWLPIFVPESAIDAYKSASNWSSVADRFKPIGYTIPSGIKAEIWDATNKTIVQIPDDGSTVLDNVTSSVAAADQSYVIIGPDITKIEYACFWDSKAHHIDFSNATSLTTIEGGAFGSNYGANKSAMNIVDVDLTNTNITTLEDRHTQYGTGFSAFGYCTSLRTIKMPSVIRNMWCYQNSPFYQCSNLYEFVCPATTPPSTNTNLFAYNTKINTNNPDRASIFVPDESVDAYKTASGWSRWAAVIKPMSEYI